MIKWLIKIISKPIIPLLRQAFRVLKVVESVMSQILKEAEEQGIPDGYPFIEKIKKVMEAVEKIKAAIQKVLEFFCGDISASECGDLDLETKELNRLM